MIALPEIKDHIQQISVEGILQRLLSVQIFTIDSATSGDVLTSHCAIRLHRFEITLNPFYKDLVNCSSWSIYIIAKTCYRVNRIGVA